MALAAKLRLGRFVQLVPVACPARGLAASPLRDQVHGRGHALPRCHGQRLYQGALCSFGETVLAKLPRPGNKSQVRWVKGVWAGKLERDDSHVVLTEAGAMNVRSVRRLPQECRHQTAAVLKACGLPWNPRFGRAAPAERSQLPHRPRRWSGENRPRSLCYLFNEAAALPPVVGGLRRRGAEARLCGCLRERSGARRRLRQRAARSRRRPRS